MLELKSIKVRVKGNKRKNILEALSSLGDIDNDFNGINGIEFLWDGVDSKKYNSNMEYLLDILKDIESDDELIEKYINTWFSKDFYYKEYKIDIVHDENKRVIAIIVAFITGC